MNAGIVILQDGTPCIVCDEALPGVVREVHLSYADYQITLVSEIPPPPPEKEDPFRASQKTGVHKSKIARKQGPKKETTKLDYPVEINFFKLLEKRKSVAIGSVVDKKVVSLRLVKVVFTKT